MRLAVFLSILFLLTLYLARRLSRAFGKKRGAYYFAIGLFLLAIGWQFAYRYGIPITPLWAKSYLWISAVCFGFLAVLLALAVPVDLVRLSFKLSSKVFPRTAKFDPSRRVFFQNWGSISLLGTAGVMNAIGAGQALSGPQVKLVELPIKGLHPDLEGFRIAQISDLHVGPTLQNPFVEEVVRKVNALSPDLVAITGDLVDGKVERLRDYITSLRDLKSTHGSFYVTGNHEYYWGVVDWLEEVKKLGITSLLNENKSFSHKGASVLVGGVPDTSAGQFHPSHESKPREAARSVSSSDFKLLLAHRPQSCFEAEASGFDVQLSGHTHAGQFFPWNLIVRLAHPYYKGLNRHGRMWVYVNAGTGYWGPPNRFLIPSEITLLTLKKA